MKKVWKEGTKEEKENYRRSIGTERVKNSNKKKKLSFNDANVWKIIYFSDFWETLFTIN